MNYKKIFKKGDGRSYEVQLRKIVEKVWKGLTFSKMKLQGSTLKVNYGGSTSIVDVGLRKSYIKSYIRSCIKRVGVVGVVFTAVFLAVLRQAQNKLWVVMPAKGAEAAFSCTGGGNGELIKYN